MLTWTVACPSNREPECRALVAVDCARQSARLDHVIQGGPDDNALVALSSTGGVVDHHIAGAVVGADHLVLPPFGSGVALFRLVMRHDAGGQDAKRIPLIRLARSVRRALGGEARRRVPDAATVGVLVAMLPASVRVRTLAGITSSMRGV